MFFRIDDEKLLEKYKTIQTNIKDLKNIELNALPVYDDRYIKTKIRKYDYKVYTNFHGLNVPEGNIECESFTVTYILVYLDNCACKIIDKRMIDYLDKNIFENDEDQILIQIRSLIMALNLKIQYEMVVMI